MQFETHFLKRQLGRRQFLSVGGGALLGGTLLAACGSDDDEPTGAANGDPAPTATAAPDSPANGQTAPGNQGSVVIGDVIDHALDSDEWPGDYGFVTFRLHTGLFEGEPVYFIRTDASDSDFARDEGLVFVPRMENALGIHGPGLSSIYLFDNQEPVLSTAPHQDNFSPAFRIYRVAFTGSAERLESVDAIDAAQEAGGVEIEETNIVVNYPVVKWPGGELPHDTVRDQYLGDGQLLEPVDVAGESVTFKLHSCYPNVRYIVTDATLMADMMNIVAAPAADALTEAGATAEILVFGNGVEGTGPMGFQKSITDTNVGDPQWSPFWDHFTFIWADEATPELLRSHAELKDREDAGELERFFGTPDTDPRLFMVNCPVPVIAPLA